MECWINTILIICSLFLIPAASGNPILPRDDYYFPIVTPGLNDSGLVSIFSTVHCCLTVMKSAHLHFKGRTVLRPSRARVVARPANKFISRGARSGKQPCFVRTLWNAMRPDVLRSRRRYISLQRCQPSSRIQPRQDIKLIDGRTRTG